MMHPHWNVCEICIHIYASDDKLKLDWGYIKRLSIGPYASPLTYILLVPTTSQYPLIGLKSKRLTQIITSADCDNMMTIHDDEYTNIDASKTVNVDEDTYPMYKLESCHRYSLSGYTAATPRTKTKTSIAEEQELYYHLSSYIFPKGWFQCTSCPSSPPLRNVSPASKTSPNNIVLNGESVLPQRRGLHRRSSAISISTSESRFSSGSGSIFERAGTPGTGSAGCNSGLETPRTPTSCSKFPYTLGGLIDLDVVTEGSDTQLVEQPTGGYSHGSPSEVGDVVHEIESIDETDEWGAEDKGHGGDERFGYIEPGDMFGASDNDGDDDDVVGSGEDEDEGDYVNLVNFLLESRSQRSMGVDDDYNPCDYVRNGLKRL